MYVCAHVVGSVAHPQRPQEGVGCLALSPSASFPRDRVLPSPKLTISARLAGSKFTRSACLPCPLCYRHVWLCLTFMWVSRI